MPDLDWERVKDHAGLVSENARLRTALCWVMGRVSWQVTTDESAGWLFTSEEHEEFLIPDDVLRTLMYLTEEHE